MSENLSERERLAAVIYKVVMAGGWTDSFDGDTIAIDGEVIVSEVVDALLAAGLGGKAEAWDEGFDIGEMYGHGGYPVSEDHIWAKTANPYKSTLGSIK